MTAVKLDEPLSILVLLGLTLPEVSEGDLAKIQAAALGVFRAGTGTTTALSVGSLAYLLTAYPRTRGSGFLVWRPDRNM